MALPVEFKGHCYGNINAPLVIEAYLDYTCPFSAKMFNKLFTEVLPYYEHKYPGKVKLLFRHQVQPWHCQSSLIHEAALAVESISPEKFYEYSKILFDAFENFKDDKVLNKSIHEIYKELAELSDSIGLEKQKVLDLLESKSMVNALKYHVKLSRQNSIHVSPTILLDGLIQSKIESSWNVEQWKELLASHWKLQ